MSSYKVLPSMPPYVDSDYYGPLGPLLEQDITFTANTEDFAQLGTFQNLQTLVEVSSLMSGQQELAWEQQDGVRCLQAALNGQPPVNLGHWDPGAAIPKLEELDSLELGGPVSHPAPRPTILPHRLVVAHPYTPSVLDGQYVNLDGEVTGGSCRRPRVKGKEKAADTGEARPCRVCGERAGKHSYYGGQVCPSCRAFFRRSVQSGYNATYFCVKDGHCEVTIKTRKNCQYCRYKLCEACGMKTTWVLTEEERKQKFEGRNKKKKKSGEQAYEVDAPQEPARVGIDSEELEEVECFVKISGHWDLSKVNDMNTGLIREFIRMVAFKHSLSPWGQGELRAVILRRVQRFAAGVQELQQLAYSDRQKILANNLPCLLELQLCSTFNPDLQWTEQLAPLLGQEETDKLDNKLRSLNVTELDDLHLTYVQFFPDCQQQDTLSLFGLINEIGSWSQDEKEYVLVSLVLLFCPDMLDLVERRRVEETQLKFATLLQKYLYHKHRLDPKVAVSRFASGMLLVSRCREAALQSVSN